MLSEELSAQVNDLAERLASLEGYL